MAALVDENSCAEDAAELGDFSEDSAVRFAQERLERLRALCQWTAIDGNHLPPTVMAFVFETAFSVDRLLASPQGFPP